MMAMSGGLMAASLSHVTVSVFGIGWMSRAAKVGTQDYSLSITIEVAIRVGIVEAGYAQGQLYCTRAPLTQGKAVCFKSEQMV